MYENSTTNVCRVNVKEKKAANGKTRCVNSFLLSPIKKASSNGLTNGHALLNPCSESEESNDWEQSSLIWKGLTHLGLYILMLLGFINQIVFKPKVAIEKNRKGYAPLYDPFEQFFSRYVYRRVRHCFNTPITSAPADTILIKERMTEDYNWTFRYTGSIRKCINMGSYNYLGFAERGGAGSGCVEEATRKYGLACCSSRAELGENDLHKELERATAEFFGVEDAIVIGMGFATNTLSLPSLIGAGTLVLSDEKNHASLITGLRTARARVRVFRHNNMGHLERLVRTAIAEGVWTKIVVIVEGVYSMEGTMAPLRSLVTLKHRYRLALYVDEAHSIGALGEGGRGICALQGVSPKEIDVLMGTFTKSFAAAGGYIAGSSRLCRWVRAHGQAHAYAHAMAPPVARQILATMRALGTPDGAARVAALRDNTRYFRDRLSRLGVCVGGARDSPVVPMLVLTFSKMAACVQALAERGVATVGVGFPATPLAAARIRFCVSAAHSRAQLARCADAVAEVADALGLRYGNARS